MKHNDCFGLACSHLLLLGGHHISSSFIQYALRSPCFCPSLCTASHFFLYFFLFFFFVFLPFCFFLLVLFVFLPLDHQQRFFTRERVACLYGCTTLVFDYLYEFRAIDRWGCRVRMLIVHGWREIRLGRRGLSVLRRMYVGSGSRKGFGSTFTKISICLLCCFLLPYASHRLILFLRGKMICAASYE